MDPATRELFLAQDADNGAFGRFVAATEGDVRRFCSWFMRPGTEIDDLVQETFLRAFRGLNSFSGRSSATSWLLTIARRVCLDGVERKRREDAMTVELLASVPKTGDTGADIAGAMLVEGIPAVFREAFVLVKILGFSYDEAAEILGCPRGTIQSRVARARSALATSIEDSFRCDVG
jgi:RNA polymerase sigma-70 factor (ECF subfamily)